MCKQVGTKEINQKNRKLTRVNSNEINRNLENKVVFSFLLKTLSQDLDFKGTCLSCTMTLLFYLHYLHLSYLSFIFENILDFLTTDMVYIIRFLV